ncbi:hypothetical protein BK125_31155, partial [Paenibacillus odorifer]|uniref:EpsG family protein n=2 Tax=Paenibacillus TaxID=44249 RepID=UPI00096DEC7F
MTILGSQFFYFLVIIVSSVLAYISQISRKEKIKDRVEYNRFFMLLSFLILTFPVAFRYRTGADYDTYRYIYQVIAENGINDIRVQTVEIIFKVLNYLCYIFFGNAQSIFVIMAILTNYFIYKGLLYESKKINLGIAIFTYGFTLYFFTFSIMRNMLGISIIFYSLRFIFEKKLLKYIITVLVATLIHNSLIAFLLLSVFFVEKLKKRMLYISAFLAILMPFSLNIFDLFIRYILTNYRRFEIYDGIIYNDTNGIIYLLVCSVPIIPFSLALKKMKKNNEHIDIYMALYILSIGLLSLSSIIPLISRFVYALWISQLILFSSFSGTFQKREMRFFVNLGIFIYGSILIVFYLNLDYYFLLPYNIA